MWGSCLCLGVLGGGLLSLCPLTPNLSLQAQQRLRDIALECQAAQLKRLKETSDRCGGQGGVQGSQGSPAFCIYHTTGWGLLWGSSLGVQ